MINNKGFSIKKRILSFKYAFAGIFRLIRYEHNAWIHLFIVFVVIVCGFCFRLSNTEWIAIIFAIGLVLAAEIFNTSIEKLVDMVSPEYSKLAGEVKDYAAGGVLICAITAVIIGLIIFVPKFFSVFHASRLPFL